MINPFTELREIYTQDPCQTPSVLELLFDLEKKYDSIINDVESAIADIDTKLIPINKKIANLQLNQSNIYEILVSIQQQIDDIIADTGTKVYVNNEKVSTLEFDSDPQQQIDSKLDKDIDSTYTLYGKGSSASSQMMWRIDKEGSVGNAIAQRNANASINVPTPTSNDESANKKYVDDSISDFSNPNLLINGDFRVNQRGQASYSGLSRGYTVDRWINTVVRTTVSTKSGNVDNPTGGIVFTETTSGTNNWLCQSIENFENLLGKTVTLSCKISNISVSTNNYAVVGLYNAVSAYQIDTLVGSTRITSAGEYSLKIDIPNTLSKAYLNVAIILPNNDLNSTISVDWIKLEIGSIATPFSPRPYGEELALCQRYYIKFVSGLIGYSGFSNTNGTGAYVTVSCPVPLRTNPVLTVNAKGYIRCNGALITPSSIVTGDLRNNNIALVMLSISITATTASCLMQSDFELDAEIY